MAPLDRGGAVAGFPVEVAGVDALGVETIAHPAQEAGELAEHQRAVPAVDDVDYLAAA